MLESQPVDTSRVCWVCFESNLESDLNEGWCRPCRCCGALKWVHLSCLQRWIDEVQSNNGLNSPVSCRACGTQYEIVYPTKSVLYDFLENLDSRTRIFSYYFTGGIVLASFYWATVTYGAVTVMQVFGYRHGLKAMEHTDPLLLLLGLPAIPVGLILAKCIHWEFYLRMLWRRYISQLSLVQWVIGKDSCTWPTREEVLFTPSDLNEFPRILCAALSLPTVATLTGRLFYSRVQLDAPRVLLGGLTYLGLKGILSVTYRELRYARACHRMIKNFEA